MAQPVTNQTTEVEFYLDLDGVMADFEPHAAEQGKVTSSGKIKYDELDHTWWVSMPACDGAKEFYDAVSKMGRVSFLSAPVLNEGCFSGKAHWCEKFVRGGMKDLILCSGDRKALFAAPHRILVDDRIKNVEQWIAAGGIGILHTGNFDETMRQVKAAVAKINAPKPAKPSIPRVDSPFH